MAMNNYEVTLHARFGADLTLAACLACSARVEDVMSDSLAISLTEANE